MPLVQRLKKAQDWSSSLRDDDDFSDDDAGPDNSHASTTARTGVDDDEGFAWGSTTDFVDIGLVDEPASLKFVETPFTLAKRAGGTARNGSKAAQSVAKPKEKSKATVPLPPAKARPAPPSASLPAQKKPQLTQRTDARVTSLPKTPAKAEASSNFKPLQPLPAAPVAPRASVTPLASVAPAVAQNTTLRKTSPVKTNGCTAAPAQPAKPSKQPLRIKLAPGTSATSPFRPAGPRVPRTPTPTPKRSALSSANVMRETVVSSDSLVSFTSSARCARSPGHATPPTSPYSNETKPDAPLVSREDSSSPLPQWQAPLLRPQPVKGFKQPVSAALVPMTPSNRVVQANPALALPHRPSSRKQATATERRIQEIEFADESSSTPKPFLARASSGLGSETRARLDRFRYIGNFGTKAKASSLSLADRSSPAPEPSRGNAAPPDISAFRGPSYSTPATARFTLPGLAPSSAPKHPNNRLAFQPAEPLSSFQARMSSSHASSSESATGEGREKVLLGAAVRSVKPILSTRFPSGGSGGGAGKKRKVGKGVPLVVPRERSAQDAEEESAEARLRRLYRSLDG